MNRAEKMRGAAAWTGILLMFAYPAKLFGDSWAHGREYCERRLQEASYCDYDYIPVLELLITGIWVILLLPFAYFAFAVFAPPPEQRASMWKFLGKRHSGSWFPVMQLLCLGGMWVCYEHSRLHWPFVAGPAHIVYWSMFFAWFAAGLTVSLLARTWRNRPSS